MDWNSACAAVIPCFNEAAHIGNVAANVQEHISRVIVVDDGSTDGTAEKAKKAGVEVLQLANNSGKGAALRRGWQRAHELGCTWVLMLDGDGQHAADDLPRFFDRAEKSSAALVIGNRMGNPQLMPPVRRYANRWMSQRISRLMGMELPDSQCGFRLAHLETLLGLPCWADRFEIESAMLVTFLAAGKRVEFIPVRTIYQNSLSKINPLTDSWRWLRWWLAQRTPLCGQIK